MVTKKLPFRIITVTLAALCLAACRGASPGTPVPQPTATPTSLPPLSGSGGGRIAFATNRDGNYEIYVMNADGSDQRRLTNSPYEDRHPVWSPDGTLILFGRTLLDRGEIDVMNADGSGQRRLISGVGAEGAWSPDGARIAFPRNNPASDLWVMNADGSDPQPLTRTGNQAGVFDPDWSPDGTQVVCAVDIDPQRLAGGWVTSIRLLDLNDVAGQGPADLADLRLLPNPGEQVNDKPIWSPLGTEIAFSAVVNNRRRIYVVNADGSNLRRLIPEGDADAFAMDWSPDGTQITFQYSPEGQWDIYVMNADGTGLRRLTTHEANDTEPAWAP
jgi:Tol biopolymer transport system component